MPYCRELYTLSKQLRQPPVKELNLFLWTLTRREEFERSRKKQGELTSDTDGEFLTVCSAFGCLCQVHCVSIFTAYPVSWPDDEKQKEKKRDEKLLHRILTPNYK